MKNKVTPIDAYICKKIFERRAELKISMKKLGKAISVTSQQINKYEKGINRISAGKLWEITKILEVPITYFYDGLNEDGISSDQKTRSPTIVPIDKDYVVNLPNFIKIIVKDMR